MAKYILSKHQIKRLIDGKEVVDGHGRKYFVKGNSMEVLKMIDERNLYDKFTVTVENGEMDIVQK